MKQSGQLWSKVASMLASGQENMMQKKKKKKKKKQKAKWAVMPQVTTVLE